MSGSFFSVSQPWYSMFQPHTACRTGFTVVLKILILMLKVRLGETQMFFIWKKAALASPVLTFESASPPPPPSPPSNAHTTDYSACHSIEGVSDDAGYFLRYAIVSQQFPEALSVHTVKCLLIINKVDVERRVPFS